MKFASLIIIGVSVFFHHAMAQESAKLVKEEVSGERRICHYSDKSRIIINKNEVCPNPWRLQ